MKTHNLTVTLRQKFGTVELEVSASSNDEHTTKLSRAKAYAELMGIVSENLAQLASEALPNHIVSTDKAQSAVTQAENTETWTFSKVSVSSYNGKRNVRVHGGRWVKFGVPLYPEAYGEHSDMLNSLGFGEHELVGEAVCQLKEVDNGVKPIRIVKFIPNVPF